jgi:hypothetical protein
MEPIPNREHPLRPMQDLMPHPQKENGSARAKEGVAAHETTKRKDTRIARPARKRERVAKPEVAETPETAAQPEIAAKPGIVFGIAAEPGIAARPGIAAKSADSLYALKRRWRRRCGDVLPNLSAVHAQLEEGRAATSRPVEMRGGAWR